MCLCSLCLFVEGNVCSVVVTQESMNLVPVFLLFFADLVCGSWLKSEQGEYNKKKKKKSG